MLTTAAALIALAAAVSPTDNILLLVADDMGVDLVNVYQEATDLPPTPNLDVLAANGVLFRNTWAYARCSPGRATIQTGRFGFHTHIGTNIDDQGQGFPLKTVEVILPEMLGPGYSSACFGKWHLHNDLVGGTAAPNIAGYPHYAGSMVPFRGGENYFNYTKVVNGVAFPSSEYATTNVINDALQWISTAPEPWFCIINFHQPHAPHHTPPAGLHSFPLPLPDSRTKCKAMVEAMDTEIGRLLNTMDPGVHQRTTVMFTADNGTEGVVVAPPLTYNHSKGTLYEGGIGVPLIVSGAAVQSPGREVQDLVCTVDIFQTVADIAGVDTSAITPLDSISFLPHLNNTSTWQTTRHLAFAEAFAPNGFAPKSLLNRAIRNSRFKLIRRIDAEEFYDLSKDPNEQVDLIQVWKSNPAEVNFFHLKQYHFLSKRLDELLES